MRIRLVALFVALLVAAPCFAERVPAHCLEYRASTNWNDAYQRGWLAIQDGRYDVAEKEMCGALMAAREFEPRDWRFAETLDELGLIAFQLKDYDLAEQIQGAAIAEMLLAVGPHGEPLRDETLPTIRPDCASGIRAYTTRLGWIHEHVRGRVTTDQLDSEPWRVFAAGYLSLDADLAPRLDWLISQYLLQENLAAAESLTALQREILGERR